MMKHGLGCLLGIISGLTMVCTAHAAVWYVDRDAAAGGDGTTWARAFKTIQPGIDAAFSDGGGEVWVAEGVYDEARDPTTGALLLKGSVDIYGGFSGDEANRDARDFTLHTVVIDGSRSLGGNEAQTVVSIFGGEAFPVRMDGFTVRDGENSVALGGFYSLILANCRIEGNGTTAGLFIRRIQEPSATGVKIRRGPL